MWKRLKCESFWLCRRLQREILFPWRSHRTYCTIRSRAQAKSLCSKWRGMFPHASTVEYYKREWIYTTCFQCLPLNVGMLVFFSKSLRYSFKKRRKMFLIDYNGGEEYDRVLQVVCLSISAWREITKGNVRKLCDSGQSEIAWSMYPICPTPYWMERMLYWIHG